MKFISISEIKPGQEIFQGWNAYAKWANSYKLRKQTYKILNLINPYLCKNH